MYRQALLRTTACHTLALWVWYGPLGMIWTTEFISRHINAELDYYAMRCQIIWTAMNIRAMRIIP